MLIQDVARRPIFASGAAIDWNKHQTIFVRYDEVVGGCVSDALNYADLRPSIFGPIFSRSAAKAR